MLKQNTDWLLEPVKNIDQNAIDQALARQNTLTKPPGSLGKLEEIAVQFSGWQNTVFPKLDNVSVRVFAADHGVCAQGVSAFPQIVTTQMIENFVQGGAAISVLCKDLNAEFSVINLGTAHPLISSNNVINNIIGPGTQDFSIGAAMTKEQCANALYAGKQSLEHAQKAHLFIGGEMGIGNTTSASAIYAAILKLPAEKVVGPGTGVDQDGITRKISAIKMALNCNTQLLNTPLEILRAVGGFEIAALTGSYIACAQQGIPVLVDGFISTAAALLACEINPGVKGWLTFSHQSAEPAHKCALEYLQASALLDLGMRLGEGSGAAVAVSILKSAISLHNTMATFSQAGVDASEQKK